MILLRKDKRAARSVADATLAPDEIIIGKAIYVTAGWDGTSYRNCYRKKTDGTLGSREYTVTPQYVRITDGLWQMSRYNATPNRGTKGRDT